MTVVASNAGPDLARDGSIRRQLGQRLNKPLTQILLIGEDFSVAPEHVHDRDRLLERGTRTL